MESRPPHFGSNIAKDHAPLMASETYTNSTEESQTCGHVMNIAVTVVFTPGTVVFNFRPYMYRHLPSPLPFKLKLTPLSGTVRTSGRVPLPVRSKLQLPPSSIAVGHLLPCAIPGFFFQLYLSSSSTYITGYRPDVLHKYAI